MRGRCGRWRAWAALVLPGVAIAVVVRTRGTKTAAVGSEESGETPVESSFRAEQQPELPPVLEPRNDHAFSGPASATTPGIGPRPSLSSASSLPNVPLQVLSVSLPGRMLRRGTFMVVTALVGLLLAGLLVLYAWERADGLSADARELYLETLSTLTAVLLLFIYVDRSMATRPFGSSWDLAPGEYQDPIGRGPKYDSAAQNLLYRISAMASRDTPNKKRTSVFAAILCAVLVVGIVWDAFDIAVLPALAATIGSWSLLLLIGGLATARGAHKAWRGLLAEPEDLNDPKWGRGRRNNDVPWWKPRFYSAWPTRRWPGPSNHHDVLIKHRTRYVELAQRAARRDERLAGASVLVVSILGSVLAKDIYDAVVQWRPSPAGESIPVSDLLALWPVLVVIFGGGLWFTFTDNAEHHQDLALHYAAETDIPVRRRWAQHEHDSLMERQRKTGSLSEKEVAQLAALRSELRL